MIRVARRSVAGAIGTAFLSLLVLGAAGCGHGSNPPAAAGPEAGKPTDDRCVAMMNEGDALLAAGNKQAAYDKYEQTRSACLKFHPVRKRIFLMQQTAAAPEPQSGPTIDANLTVDFDLQLGDDVRGIGHASYLDGEFVEPGRMLQGLRPGPHQLAIEVYVTPLPDRGLTPARLDVHQAIVLSPALVGRKSLVGGAKVQVSDRGGAGTLADRLSFSSAPIAFVRMVMLAPKAGSERLLTDISKDPHRPRLPADWERRAGAQVWGLFKVCVDAAGAVTQVKMMKSADPLVDSQWTKIMRTWRYRPHEDNGEALGFCYPLRLQVSSNNGPEVH